MINAKLILYLHVHNTSSVFYWTKKRGKRDTGYIYRVYSAWRV